MLAFRVFSKLNNGKVLRAVALVICMFSFAVISFGQASPMANRRPDLLKDVGIDQKLNAQVPLDLSFKDEQGNTVKLKDYFHGKPVVLSLVYFECPMLCNQVLNGLTASLKMQDFDIGQDFDVLTVSFNPRDEPKLAEQKKETYLKWYNRQGAEKGWHFLTGYPKDIDALTKAVGFRYAFDPVTGQYAHASSIMILTPDGKVARYLYGIEYMPKDLRLGLVEASEGKIGSPVDQVLLFCYHYDPTTGKYTVATMNSLRVAAILTIIGLIAIVVFFKRRSNKGLLPSHVIKGAH